KLRQILLTGLGDALHLGTRFVRYEQVEGGQVRAWFADGTAVVGDVLIGADGVGSNVRKQFLPLAKVEDLHIAAIGAKYPLVPPGDRSWLRGPLTDHMTIVMPPASCGMFVTQFYRADRRTHVTEVPPDLLTPDLSNHVFWALIARRPTFGGSGDLRKLP